MKNATTRGQLNIVLLRFTFHHLCYEIRQHLTAVFLLRRGHNPTSKHRSELQTQTLGDEVQVAQTHRLTAPRGTQVLRVLASVQLDRLWPKYETTTGLCNFSSMSNLTGPSWVYGSSYEGLPETIAMESCCSMPDVSQWFIWQQLLH